MNFSSIKNISPILLYMLSVACFVSANIFRDQSNFLYDLLLILGLSFFFFRLYEKNEKEVVN